MLCFVLAQPKEVEVEGRQEEGVGGGIVRWLEKRDERIHLHTNGEHHFQIPLSL